MNDSSPDELVEFVEFAVQTIEAAGRVILPFFRTATEVINKAAPGKFDPVTAADRGAEDFIREQIRTRFPDHGIVGEERGAESADRRYTWYIDPIDGTRAFVLGQLHWGSLLGLAENGIPRVGVMHQPYVGETFVGSPLGAQLRTRSGARKIQARSGARLATTVVCGTDPTMLVTLKDRNTFERVAKLSRGVRYGGDCYTPCLVAAGHTDLVIEGQLKSWDIFPLVPIVEAAGAVVTDWSGAPAGASDKVIIAANRELHAEVMTAMHG